MFYRAVQVARDRLDAATCVRDLRGLPAGRAGAAGRPDAHPLRRGRAHRARRAPGGWSLVYLPVLLSTGICPDNLDAFVRQQYRWCTGNAGIVFSRRLWTIRMIVPARLAYISGFFYYAYTGLLCFFGPLIPIVMLAFLPGQVRLRNFVVLAPAMISGFVALPAVAPVQRTGRRSGRWGSPAAGRTSSPSGTAPGARR